MSRAYVLASHLLLGDVGTLTLPRRRHDLLLQHGGLPQRDALGGRGGHGSGSCSLLRELCSLRRCSRFLRCLFLVRVLQGLTKTSKKKKWTETRSTWVHERRGLAATLDYTQTLSYTKAAPCALVKRME